MRRASILFTFLIILSVGCAELPELSSFCDDNSNDFVETIALGRANPAAQFVQKKRAPWLLARESNVYRGSDHSSAQHLPLSGQELLHLVSIQRK